MLRPDKLLDLELASRHWTSPLQSADLFPHCAIHLITSRENSFTPDPLHIKSNGLIFISINKIGSAYINSTRFYYKGYRRLNFFVLSISFERITLTWPQSKAYSSQPSCQFEITYYYSVMTCLFKQEGKWKQIL